MTGKMNECEQSGIHNKLLTKNLALLGQEDLVRSLRPSHDLVLI